MDLLDEINKTAEQFAKIQDKKLFQEKKSDGTIVEPVFIINPIHKGVIRDSGLDIDVLWSDLCEKDKVFAITDKKICDNFRKGVFF